MANYPERTTRVSEEKEIRLNQLDCQQVFIWLHGDTASTVRVTLKDKESSQELARKVITVPALTLVQLPSLEHTSPIPILETKTEVEIDNLQHIDRIVLTLEIKERE